MNDTTTTSGTDKPESKKTYWQKIKCLFGFHEMKTLWAKTYESPISALFFKRQCIHCEKVVEGVVL